MDLHDLARKVYEELGYSLQAEQRLRQEALRVPSLYHDMAMFGARHALRHALHRARARLKQRRDDPAQQYLFADWPMMGQGKLGDATRNQLHEDAQHYKSLAQGNLTCYLFLGGLANLLPEDCCVRQHFTEEQLASGWEAARAFSGVFDGDDNDPPQGPTQNE